MKLDKEWQEFHKAMERYQEEWEEGSLLVREGAARRARSKEALKRAIKVKEDIVVAQACANLAAADVMFASGDLMQSEALLNRAHTELEWAEAVKRAYGVRTSQWSRRPTASGALAVACRVDDSDTYTYTADNPLAYRAH